MDAISFPPANLSLDAVGLSPADLETRLNELLADAPSAPTASPDGLPSLGETGEGGSVIPAFGDVLSGFLRQVDAAQHRSDAMVESLALGEPVDVHQVMLALGEASNALQLTLQVRGKVLEAYQEFMRLPI
jgi:flagellar hook-basal body complex protein FliE